MPDTTVHEDRPSRPVRRHLRKAALGASAGLLLLALLPAGAAAEDARERPATLQEAFEEAAREYDVPQSVLLGVSYLQSRWDAHGGKPSVTGGYGPMHLTDAAGALARSPHHSHGEEDPRGDTSRPLAAPEAAVPDPDRLPARLRTLPRAAELSGLSQKQLRGDPAANIRGGAALLAGAQRELGLPASPDPARWYGAVARYSGAAEAEAAAGFADEVFTVIREGEQRTTDTGERVGLRPLEGLRPRRGQLALLGLEAAAGGSAHAECPASVSCDWIPAPYEEYRDGDGNLRYGNHDKADRPRSQKVEYIVVHDVEGYWEGALSLVQDPTYVSWHYTLRSSDGHIAQHVPTRDVGWHAGNWFVNAKSIGLEHEGFLTAPDSWYTEAMYRTSARLVRYLAAEHDIPLDRHHVIGHDNVPGVLTANIPGMHTDPGPYWDWQHYFTLLGAPFEQTATTSSGVVTVRPDYDRHRPVYTGCDGAGTTCPPHGSGAVRLHTAPDHEAPLVRDIGLRPGGGDSTTGVNDTGARASTGQQYAVAERRGAWTAIWYLGAKAWFHNPPGKPTAVATSARTITPRADAESIPVYGRAYPQASAYPAGVPVQAVSPLPYEVKAGQRYVLGLETPGEYYYARSHDPADHVVVRGERYYQIQLGHRTAYVKAADVRVLPARR